MAEDKKGGSGVGIAILAASAAAGYFLYGKKGAKNRIKVKGWMLKAKGEVLERIEKLKEVDEEKYYEVLSKVGDKYSKMKNLESGDVDVLIGDMKKHWRAIQKDIEPKKKKAKKVVKKAVNKAAKKAVKLTEDKKSARKKTVAKKATSKKDEKA